MATISAMLKRRFVSLEELHNEYYKFPPEQMDQARRILEKAHKDKALEEETGERFDAESESEGETDDATGGPAAEEQRAEEAGEEG